MRKSAVLAAFLWMALFSSSIVARFFDADCDARRMVQFVIVYLWSMTLMAVLGGVAYGWKKPPTDKPRQQIREMTGSDRICIPRCFVPRKPATAFA